MDIILTGLATGAIYGLVGLAFAISFYVTRVLNFAQGQLLMAAMMITASLDAAGLPVVLAIFAGLVVAAVLGAVGYLLAVRPVLVYNRSTFGWLVSTLGFAVVLENGFALIWGPTSRPFPSLLDNIVLDVAGAKITAEQLAAILFAIVVAVAFEVVRRNTLFGKLGIAVASDADMASAVGANPDSIALFAFVISGIVAGSAGILVGPRTFANPYLGDTFGISGFIAMMIGGGTEHPVAAIYGGFLLGILSAFANAVINSQASDWFPFVVLVLVLIVSPEGLFSNRGVRRWFAFVARMLREERLEGLR